MRLNFYFEFPYIDIDAADPIYCSGYTHLIAAAELYRWCKKNLRDFEIKAINSRELNHDGKPGKKESHCPSCKYGHFYLIIENPDNKKYFLISYWDKFRSVDNHHFWDLENCVEKFAAAGVQANEKDFSFCGTPYTPISITTLHKEAEDRIEQVYKCKKEIPSVLYFKGGDYDFRSFMYKDGRVKMDNYRVSPKEFIDIISKYAINIDINGAAEISCRTVDAMGLRSALIRPRLTIQYHDPLIPDFHYADLKCDDLGDWKTVADAYIERFEQLKKNSEEIEFLSRNGREWYEKNATISSHVNILKKVLNFEKLK